MVQLGIWALWAWIPVALLIFTVCKPRRAVLIAYIGAWLFLPMYEIKLRSIPDLSKITAASMGVMLGVMLFDARSLMRFRPKWFDLPMLAWCLAPFVTSIKNDLGWWDGGSNVLDQFVIWGIPYLIGRTYFTDWESFKELGVAVMVGGMLYVPLCLLEMRLSPMLHKIFYGRYAHQGFAQEYRWGGYRPTVFMQSGLAVAMWMTTAALVAVWLHVTRSLKAVKGIPMSVIAPTLVIVSILCKSSGAMSFLLVGLASLFWVKWTRNALPLIVLALIPPVYMYQRASQNWEGTWLTEQAALVFGEERARSLGVRINAENQLTEKAFEAPDPWWGWGKWSPNEPGRTPWRIYQARSSYDELGNERVYWQDMCPTDGLWVITLGQFGLVGLIALTATITLPPLLLLRRAPARLWATPYVGAAAPLAVLVALHMSDNLLNGMINPIFLLAAGGISGIGPSLRKYSTAQVMAAAAAAQGRPAAGGYAAPAYAAPAAYPAARGGYGLAAGYGGPTLSPQAFEAFGGLSPGPTPAAARRHRATPPPPDDANRTGRAGAPWQP